MNLAPFEEKLFKKSAESLFEIVIDVFKSLGKSAWNQRLIRKAIREYYERYVMRNGQIKILGMNEPIALKGIYTAVKVMSTDFLLNFISISEIENWFRTTNKRTFVYDYDKREDGLDVANKTQYLNILGAPGSGKTTFLKKMGLEALVSNGENTEKGDFNVNMTNYEHKCLPVFLELKRLSIDNEFDLEKQIAQEFFVCGFPESSAFVKKALEDGRLLILLDGIDEISTNNLNKLINQIQDFSNRYFKNRFITSCRTAFYKSFFPNFTDVIIADFDNGQIKSFIANWFNSDIDKEFKTAEEFYNLLIDEKYASTFELARTPLLLTFLCLIYDNTQKLPLNRSILYKRALEILVEKWAAEKRIHNQPIYRDLHPELETIMLSEIAGPSFADDKLFFTKEDLTDKIANFLKRELNAPKELNSELILEALVIQQGILVQRANNIFSFSHLTIHEFLTAVFFSDGRLIRLVENYLFNSRWREVFLLRAGLSQSDKLLQLMSEEAKKFGKRHDILFRCLKWVENFVPITNDAADNLLKRVVCFYTSLAICQSSYYIFLVEKYHHNPSEALGEILSLDLSYRKILASCLDILTELSKTQDETIKQSVDYMIDMNLHRTSHPITMKEYIHKDDSQLSNRLIYYSLTLVMEGIKAWENNAFFKDPYHNLLIEFESAFEMTKTANNSIEKISLSSKLNALTMKWLGLQAFTLENYENLAIFRTYIYANNLIIDAKRSALSVTQNGWGNVCSNLFST